jgi:hypothetical protein
MSSRRPHFVSAPECGLASDRGSRLKTARCEHGFAFRNRSERLPGRISGDIG